MAKYQGKSVTLNSPSRISKGQPGYGPVSYTHLTLPTICSV